MNFWPWRYLKTKQLLVQFLDEFCFRVFGLSKSRQLIIKDVYAQLDISCFTYMIAN